LKETPMMTCRVVSVLLVLLAFIQTANATDAPKHFPSPVTPEESLQHFQLDPELKIEIVAAEPEIVDPVAVAFDADGSLWVVEMRDYPHGPKPGEKPQSAIKHLFDKDGDGRYETATTFADELLFATGVLPYRDGLIVTLAGQIAFFADRDGDGKAEFRETWFSGFAQENSQLRANHPTYGPDGYVYVANGLRGGKIVAERPQWQKTGEPLDIKGFDFRFHPETGEFATITGHGQFGLCFDDYGRRFICSNRNPCMHVVLEDWYIKRNPQFAPKKVVHDVCAAAENSRLYPISQAWTTSTLHANQFTAACGVTIYSGSAYTCDPTGNLVHREMLVRDGCTFQGKSPYTDREFLASPDTWFRPVNLANGPDGALYVVDMYRAVIEHPDFVPAELKNRPDLLLGTDRGRVYRIVPRNVARRSIPNLATASNDSLIDAMSNGNRWQLETTARLLTERKAMHVVPRLQAMLQEENPAIMVTTDISALWTLQRLGAISREDIAAALQTGRRTTDVAENAIRIAESYLAGDELLREKVSQHLGDTSRLSFQAALSLAPVSLDPPMTQRLSRVALLRPTDEWLHSAILIAAGDGAPQLVHGLTERLAEAKADQKPPTDLVEALAELSVVNYRARDLEPLITAFANLNGTEASANSQFAFLRGYGRGVQRRGPAWEKELAALPDHGEATGERLQEWALAAAKIAKNSKSPLDDRVTAIHTLRWSNAKFAPKMLLPFVLNDGDTALALAACDALAAMPGDECAAPLLERFPSAVPAVRRAILDVLLAQPSRAKLLLDAVEHAVEGRAGGVSPRSSATRDDKTPRADAPGSPEIQPGEIDPARANRLLNHRDAALRERAKKLLSAGSADRVAVIAQYEPAIAKLGDANRGKVVFGKHCVTCHRIAGLGVNVGADIGDTRDKTPSYLLTAILDPNRAVDNNYFGYAVATQDGKTFTGVIAAETSTSITLKQAEGKTETILRTDIEELRATGQSFMPVGFEKNISVEDMSDLVSFLKNWRYLDGAVPAGVGAK
jgi:putative membrane-bound dehydrogenase-like protein